VWRSPVAHLLWEQGAGGSNPLTPTILSPRPTACVCPFCAPQHRRARFHLQEESAAGRFRDGFETFFRRARRAMRCRRSRGSRPKEGCPDPVPRRERPAVRLLDAHNRPWAGRRASMIHLRRLTTASAISPSHEPWADGAGRRGPVHTRPRGPTGPPHACVFRVARVLRPMSQGPMPERSSSRRSLKPCVPPTSQHGPPPRADDRRGEQPSHQVHQGTEGINGMAMVWNVVMAMFWNTPWIIHFYASSSSAHSSTRQRAIL
jgi:hypothetical protein